MCDGAVRCGVTVCGGATVCTAPQFSSAAPLPSRILVHLQFVLIFQYDAGIRNNGQKYQTSGHVFT